MIGAWMVMCCVNTRVGWALAQVAADEAREPIAEISRLPLPWSGVVFAERQSVAEEDRSEGKEESATVKAMMMTAITLHQRGMRKEGQRAPAPQVPG
jgi:hypothetical protein